MSAPGGKGAGPMGAALAARSVRRLLATLAVGASAREAMVIFAVARLAEAVEALARGER